MGPFLAIFSIFLGFLGIFWGTPVIFFGHFRTIFEDAPLGAVGSMRRNRQRNSALEVDTSKFAEKCLFSRLLLGSRLVLVERRIPLAVPAQSTQPRQGARHQ